MAHVTLSIGDLTAVIGDNEADRERGQRAGYNGVWSLRHAAAPDARSLFVPGVAGLNLEHVFDGSTDDKSDDVFFEPRRAPMSLRRLSECEAELHQPPTPTFRMESWTRFTLNPPHYLDFAFRCCPHREPSPDGFTGLFWASYINAPEDKTMYFLGAPERGQGTSLWTQVCTQYHYDKSTVRHVSDRRELVFEPEKKRDSLFRSLSPLRYDLPFFYGLWNGMTWSVMFERSEGIRFAHSPSGGGVNAERRANYPAWDFQFLLPEGFAAGREYGFRARTVLRLACGRDEVLEEYEAWRREAGKGTGA